MPTVVQLKEAIKAHKRLNCQPYSHLKKTELETMVTDLGLITPPAAPEPHLERHEEPHPEPLEPHAELEFHLLHS